MQQKNFKNKKNSPRSGPIVKSWFKVVTLSFHILSFKDKPARLSGAKEGIVAAQPREADRQFVGFAGAHGLVGMLLWVLAAIQLLCEASCEAQAAHTLKPVKVSRPR